MPAITRDSLMSLEAYAKVQSYDRMAASARKAQDIIDSLSDLLEGFLDRVRQTGDPLAFAPGPEVAGEALLPAAAAGNLPGAMRFGGDSGVSNRYLDVLWNNYAPRIGFAYQAMANHKHNDPTAAMPMFRLMTWLDPTFVPGWTTGANILHLTGPLTEGAEALEQSAHTPSLQ